MEHLPKKTCQNGISYTLVGDSVITTFQTYSCRKKTAQLGFGGGCTKPIWSSTIQPSIMT